MAEPKTRPTGQSVDAFLAAIADAGRREDAITVAGLMAKATRAEARMWGPSIVGFGVHRIAYASGRELDWCRVAFSPRKDALVLYLTGCLESKDPLLEKLGKYKTGKSCLYIRRLGDVDLAVLEALIANSVKRLAAPGKKP
jgi:hypothetical protein